MRDAIEVGYAVLGDDFVMKGNGKHTFESYLILAAGVSVIDKWSECWANQCKIALSGGPGKQLDLHATMRSFDVSFRTEKLGEYNLRLIITSKGRNGEQFCIAFHPHSGTHEGFTTARTGRTCSVTAGSKTRRFSFNKDTHVLELRGKSARTMCKTVCQNKCMAI